MHRPAQRPARRPRQTIIVLRVARAVEQLWPGGLDVTELKSETPAGNARRVTPGKKFPEGFEFFDGYYVNRQGKYINCQN
jgi:hypothetical protein